MTYDEIVSLAKKEWLSFYHDFWKQYIELERLFLETDKYVAIDKDNAKAFSMQYNLILQAICAEVDVVIKRLCLEYDNSIDVNNMGQYIELINSKDAEFKNTKVELNLYNIEILPWENIGYRNEKKEVICPYWWNGYINVKHKRLLFSKAGNKFNINARNLKQANQKNVLGALAGLFVLEMKCLEKMRERLDGEFEKYGYQHVTVELCDKFNDSIFQETIDISENI